MSLEELRKARALAEKEIEIEEFREMVNYQKQIIRKKYKLWARLCAWDIRIYRLEIKIRWR